METYSAESVDLPSSSDLDYGEGYVRFCWPDPLYGHEELNIDYVGHCSRRMPIHSGDGIEAITLKRDRVHFRFSEPLARQLKFEHEIEIVFILSDDELGRLRRALEQFIDINESGH